MRAPFGPVHHAVLGAHRERLAVLPQQTLAAEHEEDLLVGAVLVRGRRELALGHLDAPQAHIACARFAAEVAPDAVDVADGELA